MIWHLNELELLVAFRENAPSSAAAVGAAVKAVEIADCDVASQLRVGKRTVPWAEERAPKVDVCRLATPRRGLVQACCGARIRQREQRKKHSQQLGHTQFNSSTNKLSVLRARESICQ